MGKLFLILASLNGALVVALGAFGAHGLKSRLSPEMMAVYQTGVTYHFYHTLALLAVGLLALHTPGSAWVKISGWFLLAGILLFSGSLYALSLSGVRWLGAITPIGGTAFIIGWILLAVGVVKSL
jgi:uncharacterized membrane protein YgdD (TMEM256/DUF423 family)